MAGRPTTSFSLKQTLIMGFVPVLLLLLGCTLGSIYLNYDIHSHVSVLSTSASDKLRYVQHTAINLETVKQSLKTLSTTHDPEEAREAYVSTWELFSESALDRYEETREPLYQLLKDTRRAWLERQKADEAHDRFIEQYKEFSVHLIQTVALIGPRENDRLTTLARNIVTTLEVDHLARYKAVRRFVDELCTTSNAPRTGKAGQSCRRLIDFVTDLDANAAEFERTQNQFERNIADIQQKVGTLRKKYSALETRQLMSDVEQINQLSDYFLPLFFVLLFSSLTIVAILLFGYHLLIRPIHQTTVVLRQYMKDHLPPVWPPKSAITEIQDIIDWSQLLVKITANERVRALELQMQYEELQQRAQLDSLTGVTNRAGLDEFVAKVTQVRGGMSVLMVDIDHFKDLNDRHGHQFGDRILRTTAQTLRRFVSVKDAVYRYGGEEFCIVLTDVTEEAAMLVGNRLCARIREISRESGLATPGVESGVPLTVSIGVSSVTRFVGEKNMTELIGEADSALYLAKQTGRNCVRNNHDIERHSRAELGKA